MKPAGKRTIELIVNHIESLANKASGENKTLTANFISEARELVAYNEWGVALEILMDNLYEINFTIDQTTIDLTKKAIKECAMDYSRVIFIEKLVQPK